MIVRGEYRLPARREDVWELLLDPAVIARTIPGTRRMARVAHERYEGTMQLRLGPLVAVEFDLVVTLADVRAPEHYTMLIEGQGRLGVTRGSAQVALAPNGSGTVLRYRGELLVAGPIARLGRILDAVGTRLARQGLEALHREVLARLAARRERCRASCRCPGSPAGSPRRAAAA